MREISGPSLPSLRRCMVLWGLIRFSSDTVLASFLPPSPERAAVYKENYGAPFGAAYGQRYVFVSKGGTHFLRGVSTHCPYSPSCLEGFSETGLPVLIILGNLASGIIKARNLTYSGTSL